MKHVEPDKGVVQNNSIRRKLEVEACKIAATQQMKHVEPVKSVVQNNSIRRQLEVEACKNIVEPRKGFCEMNSLKNTLKYSVDHQVEGSLNHMY